MSFRQVDDIPGIEQARISIKMLDSKLTTTIQQFELALKQSLINKELCTILQLHLSLFEVTHRSIRLLLRNAFRKRDYPLIADASSLCREQVEKVFVVSLLLDSPTKWVKQYRRSSWRQKCEQFLLAKKEHAHSPRLRDHLETAWPTFLEVTRIYRNRFLRRNAILVSRLAQRVVEYNFDNPHPPPKPPWLKCKGSVGQYLQNYFEFPTPGKALRKITRSRQKRFLQRWYKEYQYICEYTHAGLGKGTIAFFSESKNYWSQETIREFSKRELRGHCL